MSDAILFLSMLFFVGMCLIPLWGPYVFFREAREQKKEQAQLDAEYERAVASTMATLTELEAMLSQMEETHRQAAAEEINRAMRDRYEQERQHADA